MVSESGTNTRMRFLNEIIIQLRFSKNVTKSNIIKGEPDED